MRILICPAPMLPEIAVSERPSHVVTIASPGRPRPVIEGAAHLHLAFHDIAGATPGLLPPGEADVEALLAFGRGWTDERTIVVSCEVGVSRSTAAALALACQHRPDLQPVDLARALRAASPQATPNRLVVAVADAQLGLDGALIEAAAAIGRGAEYAGPMAAVLELGGSSARQPAAAASHSGNAAPVSSSEIDQSRAAAAPSRA